MPTTTQTTLTLALVILGAAPLGCNPEKRRITPTTLGTNLQTMPRGRMIPQAFPGNDLVRKPTAPAADPLRPGAGPKTDPATIAAGSVAPR